MILSPCSPADLASISKGISLFWNNSDDITNYFEAKLKVLVSQNDYYFAEAVNVAINELAQILWPLPNIELCSRI